MKKFFLSVIALMMAIGMQAQRWDFTSWSAETVANLLAANAEGTEWSDIEKSGGTTADIAKENCFWEVKAHGSEEGAPLTIGGEPVKELEGLLFIHTKERSLAIAVNYGDCTSLNGDGFGPYHGPSYLWFGGKNLNYIVIPNVKPGTEIKIGVESHKMSDARGLQLFVGRGNTGTQLKDKEGNDVAYPTTYQDLSWYLPTDLTDTPNADGTYDITLRNNNGCHLYYIQVGDDAGTVKSYNAGFLYAGETAAEELPLYNILQSKEGLTLNAINVTNGLPTKDELQAFDAVVLDGSLPAEGDHVALLKENLYWQPVFNTNGKLAEALGLGTAVEMEMELVWAYDANDRVFEGIEGSFSDTVKFAITNGEVMPVAMQVTGQPNINKYVTACSLEDYYVYADSVIAYVYNPSHNQYTYYGVTGDFADGTENLIINLLSQTLSSKSEVTPAPKPIFTSDFQNMETLVSITCPNRNAKIYYTIDGSEPTVGVSPEYVEPILVNSENVTVKAVSIADGYLVSEVSSIEVLLYKQAAAPVISYEGNGRTEDAVITLTVESEAIDIYYNFTGSENMKESSLYEGPITLPNSAVISAFAISDSLGLIQSELASMQILANVDKIRRDELAHFKVSGAGWNTLENLTLDGEPMTAWASSNYYFTWGKSASESFIAGDPMVDENGDPMMDEDGNFVYEKTERALSVTLNSADPDWRLVSRGQVMIYQGNTLGGNIGDGGGYNPERAEDYLEQLGTAGDIQFGGVASGDKCTAAIESTKKFAGPFNVVAIIANVGSGGRLAVEVSKDGETWTQVGDTIQTSTVKRLYKKFERSYDETDEVFVRVASVKNSSQAVHDIYVFNYGEKSEAMKNELVDGIKEIVTPETSVVMPVKKIMDGKLVIVVDGKIYSVTGARLK